MKIKLLTLALIAASLNFSACKKDDGEEPKPEPVEVTAKDVTQMQTFLTNNDDENGKWWDGSKLYRSNYDAETKTYLEEEDISDDPDILIKDQSLRLYSDEYNSEKFGYPVGKGSWVDPGGKSGLNWETKVGVTDTLFVNANEQYPPNGGKADWYIIKLTEDHFEFVRPWKTGRKVYKDRYIWKKR